MNTEKRNTAAPAEEELENVKIGTIIKIMRKFNISYGQYIKNTRVLAAGIHGERRGFALSDLTGGIIGTAAYLAFIGVFLVMAYKAR